MQLPADRVSLVRRRAGRQPVRNITFVDDELIDLQTLYPRAANGQAPNGHSADGQSSNCQRPQGERAYGLRADSEHAQGARI